MPTVNNYCFVFFVMKVSRFIFIISSTEFCSFLYCLLVSFTLMQNLLYFLLRLVYVLAKDPSDRSCPPTEGKKSKLLP